MSRSIYDRDMFANKRGEQDITVRVTDKEGNERVVNGFMRDLGCPVLGFHLDSEPEQVYEVACGEIALELLNYSGSVERVTAWVHSVKLGQRYLLRDCRPIEGSKYHFRIGIER